MQSKSAMNRYEQYEIESKEILAGYKLNKTVFIYGTGLTAQDAYLKITKGSRSKVICFLNHSYAHFNCVEKYAKCVLYQDAQITDEMKKNSTVVVAIMNTQGNILEVRDRLKKEGYQNILLYAQLAEVLPKEFDYLYIEPAELFRERIEKVAEARYILEKSGTDERSLSVYDAMVYFRISKDYNILPQLDKKEEQYFLDNREDYFNEPVHFVDCGAFSGDTFDALIHILKKRGQTLKRYTAFEPDEENCKRLRENIEQKLGKNEKYEVYPYAVCEKQKKLYFNMTGTTASCIEEGGESYVQGISLDDIKFVDAPTHIKMDIEGAEYDALLGAEKLIRKQKPKLAICVYHKPEDIYRIIHLLESWNLGYRFYMRVYEDVGIDQVLYAL